MSRCWTLIAWANTLGRSDCAGVLKANLNEEEAADKNSRSLQATSTGRRPDANTFEAKGTPMWLRGAKGPSLNSLWLPVNDASLRRLIRVPDRFHQFG